jgi:hypothetical protein
MPSGRGDISVNGVRTGEPSCGAAANASARRPATPATSPVASLPKN